MAAANRPAAGDLKSQLLDELLAHGKRFEFFQAVRLLRALKPDAAAPGGRDPLAKEAVRFCANPSLGFPSSDVADVSAVPEAGGFPPYLMMVNFLGLFGPASPLPAYYTEEIIRSDPDTAVARPFLDMFHHRFVSFVYRAWEKYRYDLQYRHGARDEFSNRMFALIGLGSPRLRADSRLEWARLLPYLGLLGMKVRSATLLAGVVSHYFGHVPVRVEEYVPHRTTIDPIQRNELGVANCVLGASCLLGEKVYDVNTKFRLHIGALEFAQYREFLPGGGYHDALRELVSFTLVDRMEYDVALVLDAQHVPRATLARDNPCRLGYSTWLGDLRRGEVTVVQAGVA
jgi:type VI secretion system protein ImpH